MKTFLFLFLFSLVNINAQTKQKIEFYYDSTNHSNFKVDTLYVNYNINEMHNSKFFNVFDIILKNKNINCAVLQIGIYEPNIDGGKNNIFYDNYGVLDIHEYNSSVQFNKSNCDNSKLPINFNYIYKISLSIRIDENSNKDYFLNKVLIFK